MTHAVGVGIDWGSSNVRAWAFGSDGEIITQNAISMEFADARAHGFKNCYQSLLEPLNVSNDVPRIACGQIGSRTGWFEVPYISCPGALKNWLQAPIQTPEPNLYFLSGASKSNPSPDVMRGEETQILGATSQGHKGLFCLPGTHSKWARIEKEQFLDFDTYVTGELFAVSRKHTIFGEFTVEGEPDWQAFAKGVEAAKSTPLLNLLFLPRSQVLAQKQSGQESTWYLSGCLIGNEILSANPNRLSVTLIADGMMVELYSRAMTVLGCNFAPLSADACTTTALFRAIQSKIET